jgi:ribosome-binding protein aMBF1 (putative translation factor)
LRYDALCVTLDIDKERETLMTPERFRECVRHIGWSMRGLADMLGLHETRTRRWASGQYPVPEDVARWLDKLAVAHERNPIPASHKATR